MDACHEPCFSAGHGGLPALTDAEEKKLKMLSVVTLASKQKVTSNFTHTCRRWLRHRSGSPDHALAKLDLENAFNRVERQFILESVREYMPALTPWVDWTYGAPTRLQFGSHGLESQRGVQQGDPPGPFLFSLVVHRCWSRVRQMGLHDGLDFAVFYLDDCMLGGTEAAVACTAQALAAEFQRVGLDLNLSKCSSVFHYLENTSCGL